MFQSSFKNCAGIASTESQTFTPVLFSLPHPFRPGFGITLRGAQRVRRTLEPAVLCVFDLLSILGLTHAQTPAHLA